MHRQKVGWIDEWIYGQVDRWTDGRMDAQRMMDRWMGLGCRGNI